MPLATVNAQVVTNPKNTAVTLETIVASERSLCRLRERTLITNSRADISATRF